MQEKKSLLVMGLTKGAAPGVALQEAIPLWSGDGWLVPAQLNCSMQPRGPCALVHL